MEARIDALIIGGGLSGLTCALHLTRAGRQVQVLEASDRAGGRVRSDLVDGFVLDRGFQVLLTAYPECRETLDYDALELRSFEPGALIHAGGKMQLVADPLRCPRKIFRTLGSKIGTLGDKLRILRQRRRTLRGSLEDLASRPERSTREELRRDGFSEEIVERFFRPFLGGIFLESGLETSSRWMEFVLRMFALGDAALPAGGMQAIPEQLVQQLPEGVVRLRCTVDGVSPGTVRLAGGGLLEAPAVVIATEGPAAARLVGKDFTSEGRSVTNLHYAAQSSPLRDPLLVLNGNSTGPINNLCVPSDIQPSYAPPDQALVSATVLGDPEQVDDLLEHEVREQLAAWFGPEVQHWRHLRTDRIRNALPAFPTMNASRLPRLEEGLFICGDHVSTPSIQGAMASGRRAAEAVLEHLSGRATAGLSR